MEEPHIHSTKYMHINIDTDREEVARVRADEVRKKLIQEGKW